jgi:hypothetical protein
VFLGTEGSILEYIEDIDMLGLKQCVIPKEKQVKGSKVLLH